MLHNDLSKCVLLENYECRIQHPNTLSRGWELFRLQEPLKLHISKSICIRAIQSFNSKHNYIHVLFLTKHALHLQLHQLWRDSHLRFSSEPDAVIRRAIFGSRAISSRPLHYRFEPAYSPMLWQLNKLEPQYIEYLAKMLAKHLSVCERKELIAWIEHL